MDFANIFDLDIPLSEEQPRRRKPAPREVREARYTRELLSLLERRDELMGVYAPADSIANQLRWSA